MHLSINAFGVAPFALRLPSLISGALSIGLFTHLALGFLRMPFAILAVALFAFANSFFFITHEARAYGLLVALTLAATERLIAAGAHPSPKIKHILLLSLFHAALLYTHYFGIAVVALHAFVAAVVWRNDRRRLIQLAAALGLSALAYLPWMAIAWQRFTASADGGTWVQPVESLGNLHDHLHRAFNRSTPLYLFALFAVYAAVLKTALRSVSGRVFRTLIALALLIAAAAGASVFVAVPWVWQYTGKPWFIALFVMGWMSGWLVWLWRFGGNNPVRTFVISFALVPPVLFFAVSFWMPVWVERYVVFSYPFLFLAVADALNTLAGSNRFLRLAAWVLPLGMLFTWIPGYTEAGRPDILAATVAAELNAETAVVVHPPHYRYTLAYHLDRTLFAAPERFDDALVSRGIFAAHTCADLTDVLGAQRYTRLMVVSPLPPDASGEASGAEAHPLAECFTKEDGTLEVWLNEHGEGYTAVGFSLP